jgi:adenylate cyclase class 2
MSHNVEIKARCSDLGRAKSVAEKLGARFVGTDRQIDTYFRVPKGRLKVRQSSLSGGQLIPYLRPDENGPKACEYAVIQLNDPTQVVNLLSAILGVSTTVRKTRTIYLLDNVRIHLDDVEDLGSFLEFEAVCETDGANETARNRDRVEVLLRQFGVKETDLVKGSYHELLK